MSIRKALGAVKDQASIRLARVSGAVAPDLDVAIVRATSHDDAPPDERHTLEVLRLAASPTAQRACVASLARRLARTRDYVVAAKCLALLHRLAFFASHSQSHATVAEGAAADPRLLRELLRPATSGRRAGEPPLALLLDFRDDAHRASWDHSAFVRAYALYLHDRVRFLVSLLPPAVVVLAGDPAPTPPPLRDADVDGPDALLGRARQLRHLLDRVLACRPAGAARDSRVLLAALRPLLADTSRLHADLARVLAALRDRFFDDMDYPDCVNTFETYVAAARQLDDLAAFYAWCDADGVARDSGFPNVQRVDESLLSTMEQFLRERGRAARDSAAVVHDDARDDDGEHADTSGAVRALPTPLDQRTTQSIAEAEPGRSAPANAAADLVDLREPAATAAEQENKLALALFSAPPPATTVGAGTTISTWVAFDDAPEQRGGAEASSAWQKAAAEPGKAAADWELALVETASSLSRHEAFLGGGMDALVLGGMYDQGAVRRQVAAHAASGGSASNVAVPPPQAPVLMLPAPDGTEQMAAGGDPFAASLAVPPPSYVQMADMERKQQLLAQEQHMWAQYRHGGMQGQPAGFNAAAVAVAVPMTMPVPVAYYNYNQVAGGYYY